MQQTSVKGKLLRAGGWRVARRLMKEVPIVGSAVAIGLAAQSIKRKGLLRGALNTALDAMPLVGTAKNAIEIVTGDLLPDKKEV